MRARDGVGNLTRLFDVGVTAGGGVELRLVSVMARYTRGLIDIGIPVSGVARRNSAMALIAFIKLP